ncbi:hypothetical protein MKQ68_14335 [Chitinophaga horti]|uniref:Uncharacterized protein n=1 Tax=Chitinophaga horti TaxID=2920382 RepID=A0ABY6J8J5_9BACT|nr:hypothetical protein [Chitinophaga horti]UYQ96008.1 hypothetical protein MKQ68_14335 [Chitinophaga horti]
MEALTFTGAGAETMFKALKSTMSGTDGEPSKKDEKAKKQTDYVWQKDWSLGYTLPIYEIQSERTIDGFPASMVEKARYYDYYKGSWQAFQDAVNSQSRVFWFIENVEVPLVELVAALGFEGLAASGILKSGVQFGAKSASKVAAKGGVNYLSSQVQPLSTWMKQAV